MDNLFTKMVQEGLIVPTTTAKNTYLLLNKAISQQSIVLYATDAILLGELDQSVLKDTLKVIFFCKDCKTWQIADISKGDIVYDSEWNKWWQINCPNCYETKGNSGWSAGIPERSELGKLLG